MGKRYFSILKRRICILAGIIFAFTYVIFTYMTVRSLQHLINCNKYYVKDLNLDPIKGQVEDSSRQEKSIGSFYYDRNNSRSHNSRHR